MKENEKIISPKFYPPKEKPVPPISGRVYGEVAYWIAIIGLVIGIVGMGMSIAGNSLMDPTKMINDLWAKKSIEKVWEDAAGISAPKTGFWFKDYLSKGDAIAMLGIVVIAMAAILGMWACAVVNFTREKDTLYSVFATIVGIIMILSMSGVLGE